MLVSILTTHPQGVSWHSADEPPHQSRWYGQRDVTPVVEYDGEIVSYSRYEYDPAEMHFKVYTNVGGERWGFLLPCSRVHLHTLPQQPDYDGIRIYPAGKIPAMYLEPLRVGAFGTPDYLVVMPAVAELIDAPNMFSSATLYVRGWGWPKHFPFQDEVLIGYYSYAIQAR